MNLSFRKTASPGRRSGGGNTRNTSRACILLPRNRFFKFKFFFALLAVPDCVTHSLLDLLHGEKNTFRYGELCPVY
jgi:hypothetical protein